MVDCATFTSRTDKCGVDKGDDFLIPCAVGRKGLIKTLNFIASVPTSRKVVDVLILPFLPDCTVQLSKIVGCTKAMTVSVVLVHMHRTLTFSS